ncbi:MAG: hypothetical protein IIU11_09915, partial [Bacteroidales bacterium]|nr:hypothetical protein [Bacteroidales bacterium]
TVTNIKPKAETEQTVYYACGDGAVTLSGKLPENTTGEWSKSSSIYEGAFVGATDISNAQYKFASNEINTSAELEWTVTSAEYDYCSATAKVTVINNHVDAYIWPSNNYICGTETSIEAIIPENGFKGYWECTSSSLVTFDESTNKETTIKNLQPGENTIKWTVYNTKGERCNSVSEPYVIKNIQVIPTVSDVVPVYDCSYKVTLSAGSLSDYGTVGADVFGRWETVSAPVSVNILSPSNNETEVSGLTGGGDYTFKWVVYRKIDGYPAEAGYSDGGFCHDSKTVSFTMNIVPITVEMNDFSYGEPVNPKVTKGDGTDVTESCEKIYTDKDGQTVLTDLEHIPAGIYTLTVNYSGLTEMATASTTFNIGKATQQITVTPKEDLEYDGQEKILIEFDETSISALYDGVVKFRLGSDGGYTVTDANGITAVDAKDYVVWYKADETENYKAVEETSLMVTIAPKTIDPDVVLSETSFVYDGDEKKPAVVSVTFEGVDLSEECGEPDYKDNVNVGEASVTLKNKTGSNYAFTKTVKFTIKPLETEYVIGKSAYIKVTVPTTNETLSFVTDNSEITVEKKNGEYYLSSAQTVKKGDKARITSSVTDFKVTIDDFFENLFDEDKWHKENVTLTYPANTNGWVLNVPDWTDNTVTDEGENDVKCEILDASDNIMAADNIIVKIDKTPPEVSLEAGGYDIALSLDNPKNYYLREGAVFKVSSLDELSGVENIQYSLDGVSFNDFDNETTLPDGKSTVYVRSEDVAGNTSEIYSAKFTVFNDSKFAENLGNEITSAPIYYSAEMIEDQTFSILLEGNTIGAITEKNGLNLNFLETDNVIKINKEYLKTLLPGNDTILVHINPLGDSNGWESDLKPADYESQTMKIILEVKYEVMPSKYSFVMEADTTIKSFCRGDVLLMNMDFDKRYSMVDYISIDKLNINKEVPYEGIKFTVPEGTLSGGDEKIPVKFFKDDYMFENTMIFPANYPSERNIRLYDDVLALDNFDGQFLDGEYKWYMDGVEILGENKQFIDLLPYLNDGKEHIYLASVLNIDSLRFRVCPSDDFIVEQIAKKKAASVRTYPNPAVSNQPIYIELENFSDDDFSNAEIVIYNQLGIVVNRISDVKKINSIVLKDGFYNGIVFRNGVKTLNFKIIAE